MELRFLFSLLSVSIIFMFGSIEAAEPASLLCLKRTLNDVAALQEDLSYPHLHEDDCAPRVLQVGRRYLNEFLGRYRQGNHEYTAVLVYVEWCPFSRSAQQMFNQLSILFPAIRHIAVESSDFWPSELSEHGIRSLPALFVHDKASRFQFYGSRSLHSISQFYKEKTGLAHITLSYSFDKVDRALSKKESRKGTWGKWFMVWLQDDVYLGFAVCFLMLRSFWYAKPKIASRFRWYWTLREMLLKGSKGALVAEQRQRLAPATAEKKGKCLKSNKESGNTVLSVPSWPSSSFAAVAIAECSSAGGVTEDPARKFMWGG